MIKSNPNNYTHIFFCISIVLIILLAGCTSESTEERTSEQQSQITETKDYTFTQKITYKDENSTSVITKNKLSKTATIQMELLYNLDDLTLFERGDLVNFTTSLGCGILQIAFFNQTALEEFSKAIEDWNKKSSTIEDDSPPEEKQTVVEKNPLEGYKVKEVQFYLKDEVTKNTISECKITGASSSEMQIKIY